MITLDQTKQYDKMDLEQLEDLYTATIRSIRKTDDVQRQINLNSKLNYIYSMILEKKNAWHFIIFLKNLLTSEWITFIIVI